MSTTILLIHGAWLAPSSLGRFRKRFEAKGFNVLVPAWPRQDMPIEQLRSSPHPETLELTIGKLVDYFEKIVRALPEPPILIGHSEGGLVVQHLLDRGLGVAGVALDPVSSGGLMPSVRTILSAFPGLKSLLGWNRMHKMSFETFSTTFAQTLPESHKRNYYDRYWAPAPGRISSPGSGGMSKGIEAGNPKRPPLLLVSGELDVKNPPAGIKATYNMQKAAPSLTEFKSFAGRSHFLMAEPGWEEVADYALNWANHHHRGAVRAARPASDASSPG